MQDDYQQESSDAAFAKIFCCLCIFFVPLIVFGSILLAQGIDMLKQVDYEQIGLMQDECIITEFHSYYCDCNQCYGSGEQYMYHAIANKICNDQIIKSEKDECVSNIDKETPYNIGDKQTCYIYDCNEFFTFHSPQELDETAYLLYGVGIGALMLAFFCCICCIFCIATNRITI